MERDETVSAYDPSRDMGSCICGCTDGGHEMTWRERAVIIGGWLGDQVIPIVLVAMGLAYIFVKG